VVVTGRAVVGRLFGGAAFVVAGLLLSAQRGAAIVAAMNTK
jgi:hypothetical protein